MPGRAQDRTPHRPSLRPRIAAFLPIHRRAARPADARRQSRRGAPERRRDLSVDARRDPQREADHHVRDLHLLVRRRRREFADALSERAKAGVRVHVLLDWVGSQKIDDTLLATMRDAGVQIELYRPLHWYHLARLNNRTHRKLLVVDGRVGFTGGVGIADKWAGDAQDPDHWRDSHYRAEGPVVAQMQATFLDNWTKVTGVVLHGDDYFPALEPLGDARAQMFSSSPEGGAESMQLMYLLAITSAIALDRAVQRLFRSGRAHARTRWSTRMKRGVKVRMILPGPIIDTDVVRRPRARVGARFSQRVRRSTSTSRRCSTARS